MIPSSSIDLRLSVSTFWMIPSKSFLSLLLLSSNIEEFIMYCRECGSELPDNSLRRPDCGMRAADR